MSINLYYIICEYQGKQIYNAGDMYSKFLVENLTNNKIIQTGGGDNVFQIVGSLIGDPVQNSIILGTGILVKSNTVKGFKACHGLRGKITLNKIKQSHPNYNYEKVVLGDPGLTLSFFIDTKPKFEYDYGVVLHYVDKPLLKKYFSENCLLKVKVINIDNANLSQFAAEMLACNKILSSSLHGLVFAHSLGLQAYWLRLQDTVLPQDDVKFYDYLSIFDITETHKVCNRVGSRLECHNLNELKPLKVNQEVIDNKKCEIFYNIINVLNMYGCLIKDKYKNVVYDNNVGIELMGKQMQSGKFCINRIGGVEFNAFCEYNSIGYIPHSRFYDNMFTYCGYYDVNHEKNNYDEYMKEYKESLVSSTLITVANADLVSKMRLLTLTSPYFMNPEEDAKVNMTLSLIINIEKVSYYLLESFLYLDKFYTLLDNKKVLIISPFSKEIETQLKKKDKLFTCFPNFKYPDFSKVEYVNTFLTTANYTTPHRNWKETCNFYKNIIREKDFEICLLICGCYAYPLANFIYNTLNKSCIHIGGIGQLLFGIKGGRFHTPYFMKMMNEHWIYPNQIIRTNAPGVPSYDGLLGYFERK